METLTTKIRESQARLVQQGSLFVQTTTEAGTTFFTKTKKAGESFATQTRKAGEALANQSKEATLGFASGVREEANVWLEFVKAQKFVESDTLPKFQGSAAAAKLPSPREIEKNVLLAVEEALRSIETKVQDRLVWLDTIAGPQLPANVAGSAAESNGAHGVTRAPISNYDELSAKDVVARLERLSDDKTAAILAYEQAHKKRATILRAAETRLSQPA